MHHYYFAPQKYFQGDQASNEVINCFRSVWDACAKIGICDKHEYIPLDLPVEFPELSTNVHTFFPRAARINKSRLEAADIDQQALVFSHSDYVGMVIDLEHSQNGDLNSWHDINKKFSETFLIPTSRRVAHFVLYTGFLQPDNAQFDLWNPAVDPMQQAAQNTFFKNIFKALPGSAASGENFDFAPDVLPQDWYLWHKSVGDDNSFLILPPGPVKEFDERVFAWTSWYSDTQIAPFVGYLLHLSKFRYTSDVFWSAREKFKREKHDAEESVRFLIYVNENIVKYDIDLYTEEFASLERELLLTEASSYRVKHTLLRLHDMLGTLGAAEHNMEKFVPRGVVRSSHEGSNSFFDRSFEQLMRLQKQVNVEVNYLENSQKRMIEGHTLAKSIQDRESRKISTRLNKLVLWQGSFLGAVGIALAAFQAFGVKPPLEEKLFFPLAAFLGALALSLPSLIIHWEDGYGLLDRVLGGLLGSVTGWTLISVLDVYFPTFNVSYVLWVGHYVASIIIGFLAGWFLVGGVAAWLRPTFLKSPYGIPLESNQLLKWFSEENSSNGVKALPPAGRSKLDDLLTAYSKDKTILGKHELINVAHELLKKDK